MNYIRALIFFILLATTSCVKKISLEETKNNLGNPIFFKNQGFNERDPQAFNPPLKQKKLIVIDPGHGGKDLGTQSISKPVYNEKNLNLATAYLLQEYLKQMGYHVEMTRSQDLFVSLKKRALFANNLHADLFVSVHYNSAPNNKADGIEIFYFQSTNNASRAATSKQLAQKILKRVLSSTDAKSRGVKHGNLAVIRETTMPAVLIEGGFITNEKEFQKLKDPSYIKKIAWGIAQGIQDFINE